MARTLVRTTPVQPPSELDAIMDEINTEMGDGVIVNSTLIPRANVLPTGIFPLDFGLLGGIPEGYVTEVYGWEGSGKTTLAMKIAGSAQRKYPQSRTVFVDTETTFDPDWARRHGVDPGRIALARPPTGEHAVDLISAVIKARDVSCIILDSIPMLVPLKMNERSAMDETIPATRARLVNLLCSNIVSDIGNERRRGHFPTIVLINQFRSNIGVMRGDPRTTVGGNAVKYVTMTRIEMKNKEHTAMDGRQIETVSHNDHAFVIKKAKMGSSIRNGEFQMIRDPLNPRGPGFIDDGGTVLVYAKKMGLFSGAGAHQRIEGIDQTFRTGAEAVNWLYDNPDAFLDLKRRLIGMQRVINGLPELPPDGRL